MQQSNKINNSLRIQIKARLRNLTSRLLKCPQKQVVIIHLTSRMMISSITSQWRSLENRLASLKNQYKDSEDQWDKLKIQLNNKIREMETNRSELL